jgi:hypothetical protein
MYDIDTRNKPVNTVQYGNMPDDQQNAIKVANKVSKKSNHIWRSFGFWAAGRGGT